MANYKQGKWYPQNPQKYRGDVNNIIYRSSWEKRFLNWCDQNPSVLEYASEEIVIPYLNKIDQKWHRYFIDFYLKCKNKNGNVEIFLVEIKPHAQTLPPEEPKTKRFLGKYQKNMETYLVNQFKWEAARKVAENNNAKFIVITEKDLGIR